MGKLANGSSVAKRIVVRVDESDKLRSTATVKSETRDLSPGNNADVEVTRTKSERDDPCTKDQTSTATLAIPDRRK